MFIAQMTRYMYSTVVFTVEQPRIYIISYVAYDMPYHMDHKLWILIVSREYAILVYWVNKMSWYIRSLLKYRLLTNETIDLEWFFTFLNRRLWTYSFHFNFHFREKAILNRKKWILQFLSVIGSLQMIITFH